MGYYTKYTVHIETTADIDKVYDKLVDISGYDFDSYDSIFIDDVLYNTLFVEGKWYDWEKDMVKLSKEFPNTLFYVEGEGEENGDLWKARVFNGVCHVVNAEIVYPDFPALE